MTVELFIAILLISSALAMLEVQIEGKYGWAEKLPTWRSPNPLAWLTHRKNIDGYHTWLNIFLLLFFHLPYFFGLEPSLYSEFIVIESYLLLIFIEDFLWFVFNPNWGIKKFFTKEIPWHGKRVLGLHQDYWLATAVFLMYEFGKYSLFGEFLWLRF